MVKASSNAAVDVAAVDTAKTVFLKLMCAKSSSNEVIREYETAGY
jgi:hypothetical protein